MCVDVGLRLGLARRLVGHGSRRLTPGVWPASIAVTASTRQIPLPGRGSPIRRSSWAARRRGPRPGLAIAKARIRSSTIRGKAFGVCGRRRSRGRSISRPRRRPGASSGSRSSGERRRSDRRARHWCGRRNRTAAGDSRTARHPGSLRLVHSLGGDGATMSRTPDGPGHSRGLRCFRASSPRQKLSGGQGVSSG